MRAKTTEGRLAFAHALLPGSAMISHRHRFIFIHIPKTAGTSIEEALGETCQLLRQWDCRSRHAPSAT
jgi:hypothetical protein